MAELALYTIGSAGGRWMRNEDKPMKAKTNRFFRSRLLRDACAIVSACLAAVLMLSPAPCAFGQTYYEMTVHNNFGTGEFYNATPTDAQIWLLTNFKFDYLTSGTWTTGNATAGSWAVVQLSDIDQGKIRLYRASAVDQLRFYAILSDSAPAAALLDVSTTMPYNYFEWSFDSAGIPGTLDLSWIDRWDFLTRMEVSNLPDSTPTMVYGAKQGQSTTAVSTAMAAYTAQTEYAWLGTGSGGFSKALSFPGATNPIGWVTRNQDTGSGWASGIASFTNALNQVIAKAEASPAWTGLTSGIGPNWTSAGFRVGYSEQMQDPVNGTTIGQAWTAYVGFTKDGSGTYTMRLTDFTLYNAGGGNATVLWSAVNDAGGAVYEATQAQGVLECIWCSSWNNLVGTVDWVENLLKNKGNGANVMYAVYNAIASGIIHSDAFVNNTSLPAWGGYVARIKDVDKYNFEIFTAGAPVTKNADYPQGLAGLLNGQDMITLLDDRYKANALVNPYFLELLRTQEVTPAYLYPSQDVWAFNGIAGDSPILGLQTGPLNGQAAFGDAATFDWYLGGGGGLQHHLYVTTDGNCGVKSPCYSSIQAAIDAASTGSALLIAEGTYTEAITLNESKTLTLQGGWDTSFTTQTSNTTIIKAPKVNQGSLTLQMVTIRP